MNKEEATEKLKFIKWKYFEQIPKHTTNETYFEEKETINAVLNYIDKLQKENEEYKDLCLKFSGERDKIIKEEMEQQKEIEKLQEQVNVFDKAVKCDKCDCNICEAEKIILRQQKENENAKWYIHQMIARINEDIADYIDDDKEGNKDIIGELKETKKQWQDVEKLLNGESKDNLYNDWRKYGEYE